MTKMKNKKNESNLFLNVFSGYGGVLIVLILFLILFSLVTKTFLRKDNLILVLRQACTSGIMAMGVTCVLTAGSIDLGLGAIYGFSAMTAALFMTRAGVPIVIGLLISLIVGCLMGFVSGFIITKTGIPAFIATLGIQYIARGLTYIISGGTTVTLMNDPLNQIGIGSFLGLPYPIFYMIFVIIILYLIMNRMKVGRYISATGSNAVAARFAGINTSKMIILVHMIAGLLAGLSGFVNNARTFSATPTAGEGTEIDAIAAVVIGGTSMAGGKGTLIGTAIGCLVIAVMGNGLNHIGLNSYYQMVLKGVLIIVAVGIDLVKKQAEITAQMKKAAQEAAAELAASQKN